MIKYHARTYPSKYTAANRRICGSFWYNRRSFEYGVFIAYRIQLWETQLWFGLCSAVSFNYCGAERRHPAVMEQGGCLCCRIRVRFLLHESTFLLHVFVQKFCRCICQRFCRQVENCIKLCYNYSHQYTGWEWTKQERESYDFVREMVIWTMSHAFRLCEPA